MSPSECSFDIPQRNLHLQKIYMEVLAPPMPPQAKPVSPASYRINSIDLLRGLVMIIMALDHTRDFFHDKAFTEDPLSFQTTTPFLFFTRWITHFCAPVFVFLAGTSIYLQSLRKSKKELSIFLIKRGVWLIAVEIFIMSLGITFDVFYSNIFLQTIWAIGISMTLLGLVIWMPFNAILITAIVIVFGHNLLDYYESGKQSGYSFFYSLLHRPGFFPLGETSTIGVLYPFLPWTGLMMMGFCLGRIFESVKNLEARKVILTRLAMLIILLFIIVRAINFYGDPGNWSVQKNVVFTVFSFINTTKYPPSLLFMCMTIGPALLFLAFAGNSKSRLAEFITVYGRVPFLYYVLHFYLLHFISAVCFMARGHSFSEGWNGFPGFPFKFVFPGEGYSLGITYLVWIAVVLALYPVCKWFSDYKKSNKTWWLSYL